jgi:hypothetical protein
VVILFIEYSLENFDLLYYFDENAASQKNKLYNGDGKMPDAFSKRQYEILNFGTQSTAKNKMLISTSPKIPKSINGKISTFKTSKNTTEIPVAWKKGKSQEIKINIK